MMAAAATVSSPATDAPCETAVRHFSSLCELTEEEVGIVRQAAKRVRAEPPQTILTYEGSASGAPRLVCDGWAMRYRILADGRRQIFGFLLPGDSVALHAHKRPARACVETLTEASLADAGEFLAAARQHERYPGLNCVLERSEEESAAFTLDHVVRLGKLSAYERVAHLAAELHYRLSRVTPALSDRFHLPVTQEALGDALGLSAVHIHRTLKQMRHDGLLSINNGVAICDIDALAFVSGYQPPAIA